MADQNAEKIRRKKINSTVMSAFNTIEWLIIAFILAFTFRAFVVEAFRIPTGSMAPTLRGDHLSIACEQCGASYDYGMIPYRYNKAADIYTVSPVTRCPNCGYMSRPKAVKRNGDRILVFKWLYHFADPKRWDVFVFKNPTDPKINYIKRVIGRPNETIEIIDGDIYVNGEIARKPQKAQNELLMPVYNNDMQPVKPQIAHFNMHEWSMPFVNKASSSWMLDRNNSRIFYLDSADDDINTIYYDTTKGNDFAAEYSYNRPLDVIRPQCSDLQVSFYAQQKTEGSIGATIVKYDRAYSGQVDSDGNLIIKTTIDNQELILVKKQIDSPLGHKPVKLSFSILDHMIELNFGKYQINYDMGKQAQAMGTPREDSRPGVEIFGSGKLMLSHIDIKRDMYYFSRDIRNGQTVRAGQGDPIKLGPDEFFACGDNSPESSDSRLWIGEGIGVNRSYPAGIVPRDYLVGKAFYVYWPSGYKATMNKKFGPLSKLPLIPNISKMRLIYGGK